MPHYFNRKFWNSTTIVASDVSHWRRACSFIIDSMLLFVWIFLNGGLDYNSNTIFYSITYLVYFFIDSFYLPFKTGYTIPSWIMGYQILDTEGGTPEIRSLFKRLLVIWTFNIFYLQILSVISVLARKDSRAIHDVISSTVTKRTITSIKLVRAIICLFIVIYTSLAGVQYVISDLYRDFALPLLYDIKEQNYSKSIINYNNFPFKKTVNSRVFAIPSSDFTLLCDSLKKIDINDSLIFIDDIEVKYIVRTIPDILKDIDSSMFKRANFSRFIPKSWNYENLWEIYNNQHLKQTDFYPSLIHPLRSIKLFVANFFCNSNYLKAPKSIERGVFTGIHNGDYVLSLEKKYYVVSILLYKKNSEHLILYSIPNDHIQVAKFLLMNTGTSDNKVFNKSL